MGCRGPKWQLHTLRPLLAFLMGNPYCTLQCTTGDCTYNLVLPARRHLEASSCELASHFSPGNEVPYQEIFRGRGPVSFPSLDSSQDESPASVSGFYSQRQCPGLGHSEGSPRRRRSNQGAVQLQSCFSSTAELTAEQHWFVQCVFSECLLF